jgi:1,4-dihydroxy-2-naphthoate octaprenyltransferase
MNEAHKMHSIITCDLEGRIQTYNEGAERLFGYTPEEVIGHKRVSLFSPGKVVLGHVGKWLEKAASEGSFRTNTVFLGKDGTRFAAEIRITPTYKRQDGHKRHIGYCGMTTVLPDVSPDEVMPRIGWGTRILAWMVITRAPFLTATLMPILVAAAWAGSTLPSGTFPWALFASALAGAASLHIAANTFNDYFDWRSGSDPANNDYFVPYSGGSRAIELGLINERNLRRVAIMALVVAVAAALPVLFARGPLLLVFGIVGAALAYFYTAPPLRLAARRGLGELSVVLAFGPLLTAGTAFALTGTVPTVAFLVGLPTGLLAGAILWVNEFPDVEADAMTGKNHLLVTVGKRAGRWGYVILVGAAFVSVALLVSAGAFPAESLAMFLALPIAVRAVKTVFEHYLDRELIRACKATIQLHAFCGLLLAAGIIVGTY